MSKATLILRLPFALCLPLLGSHTLLAQPTVFSYPGKLTDAGQPANGTFDLRLILYDAVVGGAQQGPEGTLEDVLVTSGVFTVNLDFGAVFTGAPRWLELAVRRSRQESVTLKCVAF